MAEHRDIVILGLGGSGESVARDLASRRDAGEDLRVVAVDSADSEQLRERADALAASGIEVLLGTEAVPGRFDLGIASPGIRPSSALMVSARASCAELIGEIEYAFRRSCAPWVAITGTNGKTTVTSLVAHLIAEDAVAAHLAGNIGRPATEAASEAEPGSVIVAEVSSFQMALTDEFRPRVSVLLNITPDHIDWHGSMESYIADKTAVFRRQTHGDVAVIDIDDAGAAPFADRVNAQNVRVVRVSRAGLPEGGAGLIGTTLVLDSPSGHIELVDRTEMRIRGDHNVSNALAAAAAAYACGVSAEALRDGLRSFQPIEHRLEPVLIVDGIEYVNDSKATNPGAVFPALSAFPDQPVIVLLGGRNKDNDFTELAVEVAARCKAAVAFGEAAEEIASAFEATGMRPLQAAGLADAVSAARDLAEPGDAVLLSPACASFDEFTGYDDRGRAFKRIVVDFAAQGDRA